MISLLLAAALFVSLGWASPGSAQPAGVAPLRVSLPGLPWALEIRAPGFATERDETRWDDEARYVLATHEETGLLLSVHLEKKARSRSARECRADAGERLKRSPLAMEEVKTSETGGAALLEYMVRDHQHLHAYFARGGICADVHLSKARFAPDDQRLIGAVVSGVRFARRPPVSGAVPTSLRAYAVPGAGSLHLAVPAHWEQAVRGRPPMITFFPPTGDAFRMLLSPWRPVTPPTPATLRTLVEQQGREPLAHAVEKALRVEEVRGAGVLGYFYSLTDGAPEPGDLEHLTQGTVTVGDLVVNFTLLHRARDAPERGMALEMVRSARHRTFSIPTTR
jgi:hypothetical protein